MRKFLRRLNPKRYYEYKDEVANRNLIASEVFLIVGFIVATINIISNILVKKTNGFSQGILLFVYFLVATFARKLVLKDKVHRSTLFLYMIQIPVMLIGILMGTLWDTDTATITFFMLLICMPPFILDNPIRHILYIIGMTFVYAIADFVSKDMSLFLTDMVHTVSFLAGSLFVSLFVLAERFDNIENYVHSREKARTDELSGLKNRYAFKHDSKYYVGEEYYVALIAIDQFRVFNDMFGHETGENLFRHLGETFANEFEKEDCYRYESDQLLVITKAESDSVFRDKMEELDENMARLEALIRMRDPAGALSELLAAENNWVHISE